ncbi:hypothetical protein [Ensifer adhaerens]|uniref:hypothetical protein n=1 Tax=Ensifer adhaerens TaxID=106592 RepID=UPI00132EED56|nr:hypothetical protein [Ensifer adhaerens]QHG74343.1 hypothetical protein DQW09_31455 [Ensifer adhaerens]
MPGATDGGFSDADIIALVLDPRSVSLIDLFISDDVRALDDHSCDRCLALAPALFPNMLRFEDAGAIDRIKEVTRLEDRARDRFNCGSCGIP